MKRSSFFNMFFHIQGYSARTTVAIGPNPAWNQELTLTFKSSNNDFSPETLNRVRDCLHIHLFDEVTVDLVEDETERTSQIHQRVEKKWLGSLSIPFSSLYRNTRIEGTFR
jgi:coiled-coil and C2 domain-containing protein 2A